MLSLQRLWLDFDGFEVKPALAEADLFLRTTKFGHAIGIPCTCITTKTPTNDFCQRARRGSPHVTYGYTITDLERRWDASGNAEKISVVAQVKRDEGKGAVLPG
jgi:hypothetical protein